MCIWDSTESPAAAERPSASARCQAVLSPPPPEPPLFCPPQTRHPWPLLRSLGTALPSRDRGNAELASPRRTGSAQRSSQWSRRYPVDESARTMYRRPASEPFPKQKPTPDPIWPGHPSRRPLIYTQPYSQLWITRKCLGGSHIRTAQSRPSTKPRPPVPLPPLTPYPQVFRQFHPLHQIKEFIEFSNTSINTQSPHALLLVFLLQVLISCTRLKELGGVFTKQRPCPIQTLAQSGPRKKSPTRYGLFRPSPFHSQPASAYAVPE